MNRGAAFRGQPLMLLGGLLLGWLALRFMLWEPLVEGVPSALTPGPPATVVAGGGTGPPAERIPGSVPEAQPPAETISSPSYVEPIVIEPLVPPAWPQFREPPVPAMIPPPQPVDAAPPPPRRARVAIGRNLLLAAGFAQAELPPALLAYLDERRSSPPGVPAAAPALAALPPQTRSPGSRWSADGWLLVRPDEESPLLSGRPSYGRSQAGAVLRYDFAPGSRNRPLAYLRAAAALAGAREREVTAGLSARPLAGLPLRVAAEVRAGETDRGTQLRPAAYVVTEFPPLGLPLDTRAEAYLQGGYVGGERATAFVDGQARVERPLARFGAAEFTAGAGAWGGAQKDAARLDLGPTAAISFRVGDARGRVAADYRFRVAGDARPASGPALTLSAGF